jgi:hypothetical protein
MCGMGDGVCGMRGGVRGDVGYVGDVGMNVGAGCGGDTGNVGGVVGAEQLHPLNEARSSAR